MTLILYVRKCLRIAVNHLYQLKRIFTTGMENEGLLERLVQLIRKEIARFSHARI